jgi:hypothetical protein
MILKILTPKMFQQSKVFHHIITCAVTKALIQQFKKLADLSAKRGKERYIMSLREVAKSLQNSLPFMEGREKGEMKRLVDGTYTIREFGFLMGEDEKTHEEKEYVCFIVDEDKQNFYFGGQVLTDNMHELDNLGYHEEINKEGLPALFGEKQSKHKRNYITVLFYPEDADKPAEPEPVKTGKKK